MIIKMRKLYYNEKKIFFHLFDRIENLEESIFSELTISILFWWFKKFLNDRLCLSAIVI